jgi:hypothetical protein
MATNRAMLKEAIADAKAVKETAIANAKAALEEAFTPQLKSMLSMKLQEMNDDEDLEETHMYEKKDKDLEEMHDEKDTMEEVDLEELLAELEEDEVEEGLYEAEETEEEEISDEEETKEDEAEPIDLEDMTDEDLKSMIEDVIADMIKSGELEAGNESEEEEIEPEEVEVEDEEDVDLAELLREIEEMEDGGISDTEGIDGIKKIFMDGKITPEEINSALQDILDSTPEEKQGLEDEAKEVISEIKNIMEANSELTKEEILAKVKEEVIEWYKKSKRNKLLKGIQIAGTTLAIIGFITFIVGISGPLGVSASVTALTNSTVAIPLLVKVAGALGLGLPAALIAYAKQTDEPSEPPMSKELEEAYSTIETLKSELNEINLLNAKLLYTNKIFKSKTLNENQKVKVLSSFDKAKNVGEVKMVFETLNEGIKVSKNTINENLGRASKGTIAPNVKKPIVESNEAFLRMQKLAGII